MFVDGLDNFVIDRSSRNQSLLIKLRIKWMEIEAIFEREFRWRAAVNIDKKSGVPPTPGYLLFQEA